MNKHNEFRPIVFPGVSLNKSLNVKIEETRSFDHWIEPIIVEMVEGHNREIFDLDTSDPLNFDSTAFNPSDINKIFYSY